MVGALIERGGESGAQDFAVIFQRMEVAAGRIVVPGESVAGPEHDHVGALFQHVLNVGRHVLGAEIRLLGGLPGLVLAREVALELLVLGDDALHRVLAVVEDARHFGPALHQGGDHQAKQKDDDHGAAEDQPAVQGFQFLFTHISVFFYFP